MICKNCGYENDEDANFCEQCGVHLDDFVDPNDGGDDPEPNDYDEGTYKNYLKKVIFIGLFIILIIILILYLYSSGSNKYYNNIKKTIDNQIDSFEFQGAQVIESIELDYNTNTLKCNISPNNIDLENLNSNSVSVQDTDAISFCDVYCVYDLENESISFEDKNSTVQDVTPFDVVNSENAYDYSITNFDNTSFSENIVYEFSYTVWFGASEPDSILEKLYYEENKAELKRKVKYESYFIYENGVFKPIFPQDVSYEYVNAVWSGSDLNVIMYDQNGECYLAGPVKTR